MSKKVSILSFSPRESGNCAAICDYLVKYYNRTNVHYFKITADLIPPCHDCDYECLNPQQTCQKVTPYQKQVMDAICDSNLTYFVIPNFCGYPCANYFAFNERSVGYFNIDRKRMDDYMSAKKRFIIVSNSDGETFMDAMKQQTNGEPDILFLKSRKYGRRSTAGDLLDVEAAKNDLGEFLSLDGLDI